MIKGHTRIELRNVETGDVEVHEDDNIITNALNKIININVSQNKAPNDNILPIAEKALGAVMLFDNTLTESVDNIHWPTEAHIIACAGRSTNTSDPMNGSYNTLESGKTESGYVSVWDFGTSQANGTIRSVARTSVTGGFATFYDTLMPVATSHYAGNPSTDKSWSPIRYDGEYLYLIKGDSSTHIMRLARTKLPSLKFGVADYSGELNNYEIIASWSTLLTTYEYYTSGAHTTTETITVYVDDVTYYEDGHDGYIYCIGLGAENRGYGANYPYDLTYFTINYGDESYEKSETIRLNLGLSYYSQKYNNFYFCRRIYGHVINGVLYRLSSNRKIVYKIPLANPSSYSAFSIFPSDVSDYISEFSWMNMINGGVLIEVYHYTTTGHTNRSGYLYPDGTAVIRETGDSYTINSGRSTSGLVYSDYPCLSEDLAVFSYDSGSSGLYVNKTYYARYIGTINNLASPITKTAAQTMKIIYTFTDVDETEEEE